MTIEYAVVYNFALGKANSPLAARYSRLSKKYFTFGLAVCDQCEKASTNEVDGSRMSFGCLQGFNSIISEAHR